MLRAKITCISHSGTLLSSSFGGWQVDRCVHKFLSVKKVFSFKVIILQNLNSVFY